MSCTVPTPHWFFSPEVCCGLRTTGALSKYPGRAAFVEGSCPLLEGILEAYQSTAFGGWAARRTAANTVSGYTPANGENGRCVWRA